MPTLLDVTTKKEKSMFVDFAYEVYRNVPAYRDNLSATCKNFIYQKDSFSRTCRIRPVLILENGTVAARCAYIVHPSLNAAQIALFEALPDKQEAVDIIIDNGVAFASENGSDRILIGVNGHTSYGVGFQYNNFDNPNPFDSIYTHKYYVDYFRKYKFKEHTISTYYAKTSLFEIDKFTISKIHSQFTFRKANFHNFRSEIDTLGALINETLQDTPFFFPRPAFEWHEIFRELKPILKNENILYALKDGKEVGFLFWHPNYNMLFSGNRRSNVLTFFLKYLFRKNNITEMKINAMGIMPEYYKSGAIIGLFHELYSIVHGKYHSGETGFVFDSNVSSTLICQRFCGRPYRRFILFEAVVKP